MQPSLEKREKRFKQKDQKFITISEGYKRSILTSELPNIE